MRNANRFDTATVLEHPRAFIPCAIGDYEKTCKVELTKENLPRAHFSWQQEVFLFTQDESVARQLQEMGFKMSGETGHDDKKSWGGYALTKGISHLTLCNFRRYGWSWTDEEGGEYGYARGPVYANGRSFYSQSAEQVVRDSFIEAWTEMKSELPSVFFSQPVYDVLSWLLEDAMSHVSDHAYGRQVNEAFVKEPVSITGL